MIGLTSDDQANLQSAAADLLATECSVDRLAENAGKGYDLRRWKHLAEMGFLGAMVPENDGGLGLSEIECGLLLFEAGRACLPEPLLEAMGLAIPLIATMSSNELKRRWLEPALAGELLVGIKTAHTSLIPDADVLDLLLVQDADGVWAVEREGLACEFLPSMDKNRNLYAVTVNMNDARRVVHKSDQRFRAFELRRKIRVYSSAFLLGLARTMIDMTVEYVQTREQFGRPVGSFQAVKHLIADAETAFQLAGPVAFEAARAGALSSEGRAGLARVAKMQATKTEMTANHTSLQCHGAIGFTLDYPLHRWIWRGKVTEAEYGDVRTERKELAQAALDRKR